MTAHTFPELVRQRAEIEKDRPVYTFLSEGEIVDELTFATLDKHAAAVAALLAECTAPGDRILILCPPGLDYIRAFFGCLLAGRVAVPAYPPHNNRHLSRLRAIIDDCQATCVLTTRVFRDKFRAGSEALETFARTAIVAVDDADMAFGSWNGPMPAASDLAFLQYTSGSTGSPKGVMVMHRNLIANSEMIRDALRVSADIVSVSWLPLFHDMGLMGMLQSSFSGSHAFILSPLEFLTKPFRWLHAISKYGASISGGPQFGYDLCTAKITDEELRSLDLSGWRLAFNGSEPVNADGLDRFSKRFAPCGFEHQAHYPCYGLAEATLFVSGARALREPCVQSVSLSRLKEHHVQPADGAPGDVKRLVGCGETFGSEIIAIVDPEARTQLPERGLGEIWVAGPHVAEGYWGNLQASEETFKATLRNDDRRRYLRTGDLGFLQNGELFITGRRKDMIIVRGQNYYPQDIEMAARQSHALLASGAGAAFAVPAARSGEAGIERERVVLVHEVHRSARRVPLDAVVAAAKQAVSETLGLELDELVLVQAESVPKTSSGKVQRRRTMELFIEGALKRISGAPSSPKEAAPFALAILRGEDPAKARILVTNLLKNIVSQMSNRPFLLIDSRSALGEYGFAEEQLLVLSTRIRQELGSDAAIELSGGMSLDNLADAIVALLALGPSLSQG